MPCFICEQMGGDFQVAYKILLVDDEKGVVDMMKDYFELSGYQVNDRI